MTSKANEQQIEHWAGVEGDHWARHARHHDGMLAPFADQLWEIARLVEGERVIDVGCGCGFITIDSAAKVGPSGAALGVDLSPQMLEVAGGRAEAAGVNGWTDFRAADAQIADLGAGRWDVAVSRFGLMFFEDPVAAFANIACALSPGGRLAFCCWQPLDANEWMLVPGLAAAEHVGLPEMAGGDQPGPFSLGDPDRIRSILAEAGFGGVEVMPHATSVLLAGGGSIDETMDYLVTSGLARALFAEAAEADRSAAIGAIRAALEPFHDGDGVRMDAAAWMVTASVS